MNKMKKHLFGLLESKGDEIFFNLGTYDTFEEAVAKRKEKSLFREKKNLFIGQRVQEDN